MEQALQTTSETSENQTQLTAKNEAYARLCQAGLSNPVISEALGITPQRGGQIRRQLSEEKYDLTNTRFQKKVTQRAFQILNGKPWGSIKEIKASDVTKVMDMHYDRAQPKINKSENLNINAHIQTPLDVLGFSDEYGQPEVINTLPTPQDVVVCSDETPTENDGVNKVIKTDT